MKKPTVIFHSLYTDPGYTSFKHALFYFGKIAVPEDSFAFFMTDEDEDDSRKARKRDRITYSDYYTLIPQHFYPHTEHLEEAGHIERMDLRSERSRETYVDARDLIELVFDQMNAAPRRIYRPGDVAPLYSFLRLNPNHESAPGLVDQLAVAIVALCLRGVAMGKGLPCVDNRYIFDVVNHGLEGIFHQFIDNERAFTKEDIDHLREQYMGQVLLSLYLPAFSFRTFEEVLELREELSDSLLAFQSRLAELSQGLEGLPWEPRFQRSLLKKLADEVQPEVEELRRAASFSKRNIARQMLTAGVVVALKAMMPELVSDWIVGGGALSLSDAIKKEQERAKAARLESALSLLLEVPR